MPSATSPKYWTTPPDGLPATIRDPNGLLTHLDYDARNRLDTVSVESDEGVATTSVDYDAKGNVVRITLPDGQSLHYTYDAADRLTQAQNDLGETIGIHPRCRRQSHRRGHPRRRQHHRAGSGARL
ncbi:MAG: RHS repeat domain-containing protein [Gammaproteobacteria bacterium]|nr:RHS repeat domain-containing protein [Gammaproteobacteria bacterium]